MIKSIAIVIGGSMAIVAVALTANLAKGGPAKSPAAAISGLAAPASAVVEYDAPETSTLGCLDQGAVKNRLHWQTCELKPLR